jgi:hypothetical protein
VPAKTLKVPPPESRCRRDVAEIQGRNVAISSLPAVNAALATAGDERGEDAAADAVGACAVGPQ